jgi:hypothetical protein
MRRSRQARDLAVHAGIEDPVTEDQQESLQKSRRDARWQILVRIGFNNTSQSQWRGVNCTFLGD